MVTTYDGPRPKCGWTKHDHTAQSAQLKRNEQARMAALMPSQKEMVKEMIEQFEKENEAQAMWDYQVKFWDDGWSPFDSYKGAVSATGMDGAAIEVECPDPAGWGPCADDCSF